MYTFKLTSLTNFSTQRHAPGNEDQKNENCHSLKTSYRRIFLRPQKAYQGPRRGIDRRRNGPARHPQIPRPNTQEQVAKRLGGKQVYVSGLESRSDVKVSTLRDYVHALGGELQLMVTFPEGAMASIKGGVKTAAR